MLRRKLSMQGRKLVKPARRITIRYLELIRKQLMKRSRKLTESWLLNGIPIEISNPRKGSRKLTKCSRTLMKRILYYLTLKKEDALTWEDLILQTQMAVDSPSLKVE